MLTRTQVTVSMPDHMAKAARRKAKETGVQLSFVVQRAIAMCLAEGAIAPSVEEKTWESTEQIAPKQKRVSKPKK